MKYNKTFQQTGASENFAISVLSTNVGTLWKFALKTIFTSDNLIKESAYTGDYQSISHFKS